MRAILYSILVVSASLGASGTADWPVYGADSGGSKYSPLKDIHRGNVARLNVAWTFSSHEALTLNEASRAPAFEVTPLVIDGVMYLSTPYGNVFALDAASRRVRWSYDASAGGGTPSASTRPAERMRGPCCPPIPNDTWYLFRPEVPGRIISVGSGRARTAMRTRSWRSAIVNVDRIQELRPRSNGEYQIVLKDKNELIWTRRFVTASLRALLGPS